MKPLLVFELLLLISTVSFGQAGEATLVDKFNKIGCSDFRGRVDSFMADLADNPTTTGYVVLSGEQTYLDVFVGRRRLVESQFVLRNFDNNRIVFVRRAGLPNFETELWKVEKGGKLPFDYEANWPLALPRKSKPFVLITVGFDESECPPMHESELVARFLKANPHSRTNIVIRCRGRNCFRDVKRVFKEELVTENGVSQSRVKFYYIPIDSEYFTSEFWILN